MRARDTPRPIGSDGHSPVPLVEDVLTEEQIETYLGAVRSGAGMDIAAREVGMTATRMRRFRNRDEAFRVRVEEAIEDAAAVYRDELRRVARKKATEDGSDRLLEVELATHVPSYEHLRRDRVKVDGRLEHAIVLDMAALERMTPDRLRALRDILAELDGDVILDGEVRELADGVD